MYRRKKHNDASSEEEDINLLALDCLRPTKSRVADEKKYNNIFVAVSAMLYDDVAHKPHELCCLTQELIKARHDAFFTLLTIADPEVSRDLMESNESDKDLNKRRERFVKGMAEKLTSGSPMPQRITRLASYAIATVLKLEVFVLERENDDEFAWTYYPVLLNLTQPHELLQIQTTCAEAQNGFITICANESDELYAVTSTDKNASRPSAYGMLGSYIKDVKPGEKHYKTKLETLKNLEKHFIRLNEYIGAFVAAPMQLKERRKRLNTAVIATSATGIVGGGIALAGIALTPFTFGVSLGLTVLGAAVGAGSGTVQAGFRIHEAAAQNKAVKEIKNNVKKIEELGTAIAYDVKTIYSLFQEEQGIGKQRKCKTPTISTQGFMSIGNVIKSIHTGAAVAVAALKVGTTGAAVAASIIGPVSMIVDIAFLADAIHDKVKGDRSEAGQMIECIIIPNIVLITLFMGNQTSRFVDSMCE